MVHSANNNSLINLEKLPIADRYCVAFSGGVDSTALLIAASEVVSIKDKLFAVHINHHIQLQANDWANHCTNICQTLNVPLITESVNPENHSENACRQARISVFKKLLNKSDCLLIAHHADDQVETILFRMFRGTGIGGLSGMSGTHKLFGYMSHRPFLGFKKEILVQYVQLHGIKHITDNSNSDLTYRRNYLRNNIIPIINSYEDDAFQNIIHTSQNINKSNDLLAHLIGSNNPLSINPFSNQDLLSTALYHWLGNLTNKVSASQKQLLQFANDCLNAAEDKNTQLDIGTVKLIHWQNQVYALNKQPTIDQSIKQHQLISNQALPIASGSLLLHSNTQLALDIEVAYQKGSKNILLSNHKISKKVKNLFQENNIPPWIRQNIPYIFINDELMAVGSVFVSKLFEHFLETNNAQFEWVSPQFLL